ncbi:MAG: hypothetical protein PHC61_00250 [Chitinivibrionales bacterium]|nr:hypothetical protein [Chitinivibrionales bacterium]
METFLNKIKSAIDPDIYKFYLVLLLNAKRSSKVDENHFIISSGFISQCLKRVVQKQSITSILDSLCKKSIKLNDNEGNSTDWYLSLIGSWIVEIDDGNNSEFKIKYYLSPKVDNIIKNIDEELLLKELSV